MKVASALVVLVDIVVNVNPGVVFAPAAEEEPGSEAIVFKDVEGVLANRRLEGEDAAE